MPEGWTVVPVADLATVSYGLTVNSQRRESVHKRPYLTVANAQDDGFDFSTVKEIGTLPSDDERFGLRRGDVLVIEGNANPARLGRALEWSDEIPGALHQNHLIRARCTSANLSPSWLVAAMNGDAVRRQVLDQAKTSSGLHTINSSVVSRLLVPVPPIDEQREMVETIAVVATREKHEASVNSQLIALKFALSTALLTGELRVPLPSSAPAPSPAASTTAPSLGAPAAP